MSPFSGCAVQDLRASLRTKSLRQFLFFEKKLVKPHGRFLHEVFDFVEILGPAPFKLSFARDHPCQQIAASSGEPFIENNPLATEGATDSCSNARPTLHRIAVCRFFVLWVWLFPPLIPHDHAAQPAAQRPGNLTFSSMISAMWVFLSGFRFIIPLLDIDPLDPHNMLSARLRSA